MHPITLAALATWIVNDHYLKGAHGGVVTGKLSDVACLIVVPLMMGGILAGFVISFVTAAVEISETILLTSRESLAPMSYGIYLYMQSIAGRGPGAALGVIAVALVAVGTYLSHRFVAANSPQNSTGGKP